MSTVPEQPNVLDGHGHKTGAWREPDPHGGTMVGEYVDGERHGAWRHYFASGELRAEGSYDHGTPHGPWTWYRSSGGLLQRGEFHHGDKHGRWQRWSATGTPIDSGDFDRGKKSGEWTYHNPDGSIKRTTVHRPRTPRA